MYSPPTPGLRTWASPSPRREAAPCPRARRSRRPAPGRSARGSARRPRACRARDPRSRTRTAGHRARRADASSAISASVVGQTSGQCVKPVNSEAPAPLEARAAERPARLVDEREIRQRARLGQRRAGAERRAAPRARSWSATPTPIATATSTAIQTGACRIDAVRRRQAREPPFQPSRFRNSRRVFGPRVRKCGSGRSR